MGHIPCDCIVGVGLVPESSSCVVCIPCTIRIGAGNASRTHCLVPVTGIEPARPYGQLRLKQPCLPTFHHTGIVFDDMNGFEPICLPSDQPKLSGCTPLKLPDPLAPRHSATCQNSCCAFIRPPSLGGHSLSRKQ